jgi:chromosome segregation ATPase
MRLCILAMALAAAGTASAAPPGTRDPDWPCQQIKVQQLSLASVWSGSAPNSEGQQDQHVVDLAREMAQRRVPIEVAQQKIRSFAQQSGEQKQVKLLELLTELFNALDAERSSVIAGLDRYGARQKELAAQLRDDNEKLRAMHADPSSKPDEVNQMTERVTWEAEVFEDRRQALSYACDVPAKIEQRLFGLARTIQDALR